MGGLAHTIEQEGVATTQISLVREHTQAIQPPRALWVPFELGRPLGVPDDSAFQTRVLMAALGLLEAPGGPLIADFLEEAPIVDAPAGALACPVNLRRSDEPEEGLGRLLFALKKEVEQMRNWYDLAVEKRARTTTGTTGLTPQEAADFLAAFARGDRSPLPVADVTPATALRMAAEDLKAYYLEGVTGQPGQPTGSVELADWFWGCTNAARVINAIRIICLEMPDDEFQLLGKVLLVPRVQLHHFQG